MKVLAIIEWDNVKDEETLKKLFDFYDKVQPLIDKKHEGVKFKDHGGWAEQPGHPIWIREYESMEEFSKVWSDEEYQTEFIKIGRLVKNIRMRILRPIIHTPPS